MIPAPTPANELQRLTELLRLKLLDRVADAPFDAVTRCLALGVCAPTALISLVDANRQWFMCRVGLDATETPRAVSFCGHAVCGTEPFVIPDALRDKRFADNPLVLGPPYVRAYLGIPLITSNGNALGSLCATDIKPRAWTGADVALARDLALITIALIEARALKTDLGDSFTTLANLFQQRAQAA